jgi:hypothetical protein
MGAGWMAAPGEREYLLKKVDRFKTFLRDYREGFGQDKAGLGVKNGHSWAFLYRKVTLLD